MRPQLLDEIGAAQDELFTRAPKVLFLKSVQHISLNDGSYLEHGAQHLCQERHTEWWLL